MLSIPTLFVWPLLQISMSVKHHQTVREASALTVWAHTTVSARRATCWLGAGDAKVSVFFSINTDKSVSPSKMVFV